MRTSFRKSRSSAAVAVAMLLVLTACSGSDSSSSSSTGCDVGPTDDPAWAEVLEAAAEEEGPVNVYFMYSEAHIDPLFEAFAEACPTIDVTPTRGSNDLLPRVEAEIQSKSDGADIFIGNDPNWYRSVESELLELQTPEQLALPESAYPVPGKAVVTGYPPMTVLVWNTNAFPDGFESITDLTDPELEGKIGMRDGLNPSYVAYLEFLEQTYGEDFLVELGEQKPKFYSSVVALSQAVASGEIAVSTLGFLADAVTLAEQGAPIDYVATQPALFLEYTGAALSKSPRPNAARVFMAFLQSEEGQAAISGTGYSGSARGVAGSVEMKDAEFVDTAKVTPEILREWEDKFAEYFPR